MKKYSKEFIEEALKLSDKIGVKKLRSNSASRTARWRTVAAYAKKHRQRRHRVRRNRPCVSVSLSGRTYNRKK